MDKIKIKLTLEERDLILDHVLILDDDIIDPMKKCELKSNYFELEYSMEALERLLEFIAAESNHAENKKIEDKLDTVYEKLNDIFESGDNLGIPR